MFLDELQNQRAEKISIGNDDGAREVFIALGWLGQLRDRQPRLVPGEHIGFVTPAHPTHWLYGIHYSGKPGEIDEFLVTALPKSLYSKEEAGQEFTLRLTEYGDRLRLRAAQAKQ